MKFYTLILDRSGSMDTIWNDITKAVNNHLEMKAQGSLVTLQLFDTERIDYLFKYDHQPKQLDRENFKPRGGTPLRDAIMDGITSLSKDWGDFLRNDNVEVEFTIFTDGEENSSTQWSSNDVARAINHFQDNYGWKFSFIGAGSTSDIANYAKQFGIRSENVVGYQSSDNLVKAFATV